MLVKLSFCIESLSSSCLDNLPLIVPDPRKNVNSRALSLKQGSTNLQLLNVTFHFFSDFCYRSKVDHIIVCQLLN